MKVDFTISELNKYVLALTGQAGIAKGDYAKYVCDEDRWPLLIPFYEGSVAEIQSNLRRKLQNSLDIKFDGGNLSVSTQDDIALRQSVLNLASSELRLSVVYMVSFKWLSTIDKELAESYGSESEAHLTNALDAMRVRDITYTQETSTGDSVTMQAKSGDCGMENASGDEVDMAGENDTVQMSGIIEDTDAICPSSGSEIFGNAIEDTVAIERTEPCNWPGHFGNMEDRIRCSHRRYN